MKKSSTWHSWRDSKMDKKGFVVERTCEWCGLRKEHQGFSSQRWIYRDGDRVLMRAPDCPGPEVD